jgi:hypothetical protein
VLTLWFLILHIAAILVMISASWCLGPSKPHVHLLPMATSSLLLFCPCYTPSSTGSSLMFTPIPWSSEIAVNKNPNFPCRVYNTFIVPTCWFIPRIVFVDSSSFTPVDESYFSILDRKKTGVPTHGLATARPFMKAMRALASLRTRGNHGGHRFCVLTIMRNLW